MKKLIFIVLISLLISACTATKEQGTTRAERKQKAKATELAAVKNAVESRRYIIRMNRIYMTGGGHIDLVPRNNYIVVDGEAASISLAYAGRNFGRPISGINFNGQTTKYNLVSNAAKGVYNIDMEVSFKNTRFTFYVSIGSGGWCNVSVNNSYLEPISYSGRLVPITKPSAVNPGNTDRL